MFRFAAPLALLLSASGALAQTSTNPFPTPIEATDGVVAVNFVEFAVIPDAAGGEAPRMMHLVDEPGTRDHVRQHHARPPLQRQLRRQDGHRVSWTSMRRRGASACSRRARERGFQSFAFHPQFNQRRRPRLRQVLHLHRHDQHHADAGLHASGATTRTHDTVLLEWTAKNPAAATYDGGAARRISSARRSRSPITTAARSPSTIWRSPAPPTTDCSTSGLPTAAAAAIPMNLSQNLAIGVRQDPAHRSARHEQRERQVRHPRMRIPSSATTSRRRSARSSRMASATRSASPGTARISQMYVADIGQNIVEEISPVTTGANLGWNKCEGSYTYREPPGRPDQSAQRQEHDLADRRVRSYRSAVSRAPAITGVYVYARKRREAAAEPDDFRRQPERRDFLPERR